MNEEGVGSQAQTSHVCLLQRDMQQRAEHLLREQSASPFTTILVLDAQQVSRPREDWFASMALISLPGAEDMPDPLDRIRVTAVKSLRSRSFGPIRLYSTQASRVRLIRSSGGLPGLAGSLPPSPFLLAGTPVWQDGLFELLPPMKGFHCDVVGILLHSGVVTEAYHSCWVSSCSFWVLAPGRRICRILVQEFGASKDEVLSRLRRSRQDYCSVGAEPAAFENVVFDWVERRCDVVHFKARRLQLRVTTCPRNVALRQSLAWVFFSHAEITSALSSLSLSGELANGLPVQES